MHTQIGSRCIGAKVNHKLVPPSHQLSSGDQVEIITSRKQKPKEDWLNYVVTASARSKIRHALRDEERAVANDGKDKLRKWMRRKEIAFNDANIDSLMRRLKDDSPHALFLRIEADVAHVDADRELVGDQIISAEVDRRDAGERPRVVSRLCEAVVVPGERQRTPGRNPQAVESARDIHGPDLVLRADRSGVNDSYRVAAFVEDQRQVIIRRRDDLRRPCADTDRLDANRAGTRGDLRDRAPGGVRDEDEVLARRRRAQLKRARVLRFKAIARLASVSVVEATSAAAGPVAARV